MNKTYRFSPRPAENVEYLEDRGSIPFTNFGASVEYSVDRSDSSIRLLSGGWFGVQDIDQLIAFLEGVKETLK